MWTGEVSRWALGVLLFLMVTGRPPFQAEGEEVFKLIKTEPVRFPPRNLLQEPTKQIIGGLLTKEPTERLGCGPTCRAELRGHAFFHGIDWQELEEGKVAPPFIPDTEVLDNFDKEFCQHQK